jgi:hypothetical protein
MPTPQRSKLTEALAAVPDPRRQCQNLRHALVDVLAIGFCGVLCGCEDLVELEEFGRAKEALFRRFLELENGIPSHDTFRRVFQAVCPLALQQALIAWLRGMRQAADPAEEKVIAIDGKALRRAFDRAKGLEALHLVGAWATANGLTLGQVAVEAKSNEMTAIPQLLDLLDLQACVVTIDAAGCQKEIAARIVAKGGDVDDGRRQLPCDLVHVGDHQQQALGRRERRRQGPGLQRAVHGSGLPALALHLDDGRHTAPEIRPSLGGPLIGPFTHR